MKNGPGTGAQKHKLFSQSTVCNLCGAHSHLRPAITGRATSTPVGGRPRERRLQAGARSFSASARSVVLGDPIGPARDDALADGLCRGGDVGGGRG